MDKVIRNLREEYRVNQDDKEILAGIKCFAFDLDGTVYYDETWYYRKCGAPALQLILMGLPRKKSRPSHCNG